MMESSSRPEFWEELAPQQQSVLDSLKRYVREDLGVTDKRYDDWYLLRFCRAKAFHLEETKKMFANCLEWRRTNGIDNINLMDITPVRQVDHLFPHNYYCVDREGQCVYIEKYKNFDLKEIKRVGFGNQDPRHEVCDRLFHLRLRESGPYDQSLPLEETW